MKINSIINYANENKITYCMWNACYPKILIDFFEYCNVKWAWYYKE